MKWTLNRSFGLELANAAAILEDHAESVDHGSAVGHHPRAPRRKVNIGVRLLGGRPPRPAIVRNISACGMLLETSPGLIPGQHLMLRIGKAPPVYGRVQWSKDGRTGFRAHNAISVLAITCADE